MFATNTGLIQYNKHTKTESILLSGIPVLSVYSGTQDILWVVLIHKVFTVFFPHKTISTLLQAIIFPNSEITQSGQYTKMQKTNFG